MPRTKAFDPSEKVDDAVTLFWRQGFDGTGVQAIVDALGVSRASLYDTFGDKSQLWHTALQRYCDEMDAWLNIFMTEGDDPLLVRTDRLFTAVIDPPAGQPAGCLLTRAITERITDPETSRIVHRQLDRARDCFVAAFTRAADDGEIGADADVTDLAAFMLSMLEGMFVMAAAGSPKQPMLATKRIVQATLAGA